METIFMRSVCGNIMVQPTLNQKKTPLKSNLLANFINCCLVMQRTRNATLAVPYVVIGLFVFSSPSIAQNVEEAPVYSPVQNVEESPAYAPAVSPETKAWLEELASKAETREAKFAFVHCDDAMDFGDCREKYKEFVKQSPWFFGRILGYAAVRENNVTLCNSLIGEQRICRDVDGLTFHRRFAVKQCEDFPPSFQPICVNQDSCTELKGRQKDFCLGFKNGDLALIKKAQTSTEFCSETGDCEWNEADNAEALAAYYGFKVQRDKGKGAGKQACERYARGLEGAHAYLCEILFSESPINDVLDGVATDLAYYLLSEDRKASFLCKNIKNNKLKAGCLSPDSDKYLKDNF